MQDWAPGFRHVVRDADWTLMFFLYKPEGNGRWTERILTRTASNTASPERNRFTVLFFCEHSGVSIEICSPSQHDTFMNRFSLYSQPNSVQWAEFCLEFHQIPARPVGAVKSGMPGVESCTSKVQISTEETLNLNRTHSEPQQNPPWTSTEQTLNLNRTNSEPQQNKLWISTEQTLNLNRTNSEPQQTNLHSTKLETST